MTGAKEIFLEQSPSTSQVGGDKPKRLMRNFLLQPLLQVKLGLYAILLSAAFAGALATIIPRLLARYADMDLSDVRHLSCRNGCDFCPVYPQIGRPHHCI